MIYTNILYLNALTMMLFDVHSVIYASLNEELGMSRDEASLPFSMLGTVSNMFGKL